MKQHRPLLTVCCAFLAFVALEACGPTHSGLCERAAECGGGRDLEIDACIVDLDAREEQADLFDCPAEWDRYLECLDNNGACDEDSDALGGCDSERDTLNECIWERRAGDARVRLIEAE